MRVYARFKPVQRPHNETTPTLTLAMRTFPLPLRGAALSLEFTHCFPSVCFNKTSPCLSMSADFFSPHVLLASYTPVHRADRKVSSQKWQQLKGLLADGWIRCAPLCIKGCSRDLCQNTATSEPHSLKGIAELRRGSGLGVEGSIRSWGQEQAFVFKKWQFD